MTTEKRKHHMDGAFARSTMKKRADAFRNTAAWHGELLTDIRQSMDVSEAQDDRAAATELAGVIIGHIAHLGSVADMIEALAKAK